MYNIEQIIESTNMNKADIKHFTSLMVKYDLLKSNEQLDDRAVKVLKNANTYKQKNDVNWKYAFITEIQKEYLNELSKHFTWSKNILLKDLLWQIEEKKVTVYKLTSTPNGMHILTSVIDNFIEISTIFPDYLSSNSTDGNEITSFLCQGETYQYYLIGKLNIIAVHDNIEKDNCDNIDEDIHVFYNDNQSFNIMKCEYIAGGNSSTGLFYKLFKACCNNLPRNEK